MVIWMAQNGGNMPNWLAARQGFAESIKIGWRGWVFEGRSPILTFPAPRDRTVDARTIKNVAWQRDFRHTQTAKTYVINSRKTGSAGS